MEKQTEKRKGSKRKLIVGLTGGVTVILATLFPQFTPIAGLINQGAAMFSSYANDGD